MQTIGDAYIAVTGMVEPHRNYDAEESALPTARRQKNNAVALASFACTVARPRSASQTRRRS